MRLLVIRHGPAGETAAWEAQGRDDRQRPLTPDGRKQMRRAAAGLATLVPSIDVLATSPLTRAVQSAEILADEYHNDLVTTDVLVPESDPEETVKWLRELEDEETVAVVGHEPHLGLLIGYLLTGKRSSFLEMKKAGAGFLELDDSPRPGGGTLEWLVTPRMLRRLGE